MITLVLAQAAAPIPAANQIYINLTRLSDIPDPLLSVRDGILAMAYTLTVAGFFVHFWTNRENPAPGFGTLLRCLIVVACITLLPLFRGLLETIFYYVPDRLNEDLAGVNFAGDRIRQWVHSTNHQANGPTLSLLRFGFEKLTEWLISSAFSATATAASFIVLPFYFIHRFGVMLGFGFMPVALACLTIPALAGKATNYIMSILSVLAWPLGFTLSSIAANAVLDVATYDSPLVGSNMIMLFVPPLIAGLVLIVGTTSTPLFAYYLFTTGGAQMPNVGAAQIGSAARSMASTAGRMAGLKP